MRAKGVTPTSAVRHVLLQLPLGFLLSFLCFFAFWTLTLKPILDSIGLRWPRTEQSAGPLPNIEPAKIGFWDSIWSISNLSQVGFALLVLSIWVIGLFLIYNVCILLNRSASWSLVTLLLKTVQPQIAKPYRPPHNPDLINPFKGQSIGIVLAGGGAKGAFQAGAMTGIYRFLAERGALDDVKVIAATSIGSWNSLFWLADLIETEKSETPGALQLWWQSIRLASLVAPGWYVPGMRNCFCEAAPWERTFEAIFKQPEVRKRLLETKINFYFVRHKIGYRDPRRLTDDGPMAFTTNSSEMQEWLARTERVDREASTVLKVPIAEGKEDEFISAVKKGVFASMDLPPLFPYVEINDAYFEDGGVINNLPVMFPAMEGCDVIFVLPLFADLAVTRNRRSIIRRMLRVMDVRQGAMEQSNLKDMYLYNELAALRDHAHELARSGGHAPSPPSPTLERALRRRHKEAKVFVIGPDQSFVKDTIDTHQFWRANNADLAFRVMEKVTTGILQEKDFSVHHDVELIKVTRGGGYTTTSNL